MNNNNTKGSVDFEHVSKRFRLGGTNTFRDAVSALFAARRGNKGERSIHWAVRDVSFHVEPGEAVGLIGPNGAGKTTTLKLLSNITQPTSGQIRVGGRLSSLIELGAGFHPELTGRENIFLNGAILGLKKREIARKLDAIIAFSELERFIDTPIKRYSSGMYVRLGFAVAAHTEPDTMLVDEVLAVGDAAFRQKCMNVMADLSRQGTTIIFVSHNMYLVRRLCRRVLLLWQGQVRHDGSPDKAIANYEQMLQASKLASSDHGKPAEGMSLLISDVCVADRDGMAQEQFAHGDCINIKASYLAASPISSPVVRVRLLSDDDTVVAMFASHQDQRSDDAAWALEGSGTFSVTIPSLEVVSGRYSVELRVLDTTDNELLAAGHSAPFQVQSQGFAHEVDRGKYLPRVIWHLPRPSGAVDALR